MLRRENEVERISEILDTRVCTHHARKASTIARDVCQQDLQKKRSLQYRTVSENDRLYIVCRHRLGTKTEERWKPETRCFLQHLALDAKVSAREEHFHRHVNMQRADPR